LRFKAVSSGTPTHATRSKALQINDNAASRGALREAATGYPEIDST
jgi:hypothetical protein